MYTLAIDTSATLGSVAIFNNNVFIAASHWEKETSHSEMITSAAQKLFAENNIQIKHLNRIAVCTGPGSFTGIRVGINFARAIAHAFQLPVYCDNSLRLLVSQPGLPDNVLIRVVHFAFRDIVYTAEYRLDKSRVAEVSPPEAITIEKLAKRIDAKTLILGSGYSHLLKALDPGAQSQCLRIEGLRDYSLAEDFLLTAALDENPAQLNDWIHTIPLYIRASEAEEKLKSQGH
jgi:tRNA threonylcarbamoyl adenosine modification protein YeaZ